MSAEALKAIMARTDSELSALAASGDYVALEVAKTWGSFEAHGHRWVTIRFPAGGGATFVSKVRCYGAWSVAEINGHYFLLNNELRMKDEDAMADSGSVA